MKLQAEEVLEFSKEDILYRLSPEDIDIIKNDCAMTIEQFVEQYQEGAKLSDSKQFPEPHEYVDWLLEGVQYRLLDKATE